MARVAADGIRQGIVSGITSGPNQLGQQFPNTVGECISQLGFTPEHMWQFKSASGSESDLVGSVVLSPAGTPTQGVTPPGGTQPGIEFAGGSAQRIEAPNLTDLDVTTGSVFLMGFSYLYADSTNNELAGKGNGPVYLCSLVATRRPWLLTHDGVDTVAPSTNTDHGGTAFPWMINIDRSRTLGYVATPEGVFSASTSLLGSVTDNVPFRVGATSSLAAHAITQFIAWTSGANAEGLDHEAIIAKAQATMGIP